MSRRTLLAALASALFCAPAAAAHGVAVIHGTAAGTVGAMSDTFVPTRFTGRLVVSFHGDAAAGCAVRGLCGYSGTIIWTPSPSALIDINSTYFGRLPTYFVDLQDGTDSRSDGGLTEAVTRHVLPALSGMSASGAACGDAAHSGDDLLLPLHKDRLEFDLASVASPSLIETRCAGPMIGDIAPTLPKAAVPFAAIRRGDMTIGLGGTHRFASHGFAGTVDSTLSLQLGKPGRPQASQGGSGPTGEPDRLVTVSYTATVSGAVVTTIGADGDPALCGPLGACGLRGTLTLSLGRTPSAELTATGPERIPYRDFLIALGLRRGSPTRRIELFGFVSWSNGGVLRASISGGGTICTDSAAVNDESLYLGVHGRKVVGQLGTSSGGGYDFRTRCPGPIGPQGSLGTGSGQWSPGLARKLVIPLTGGSSFTDDGYRGRTSTSLTLTLTSPRLVRHAQQVVTFTS